MTNYYSKTFFAKFSRTLLLACLFFCGSIHVNAQATCCPKFTMNVPEICEKTDTICLSLVPQGTPGGRVDKACKGTTNTYAVYPNLPGYTYTWTVNGGTPTSITGNPATITWGYGSVAGFTVVVAQDSGSCRDSFSRTFCMVNGPKADFTFTSPTCSNQFVTFTNTSVGGSNFTWNFGDGTSYTGTNPTPHTYPGAGTYIVTLTANNNTSNSIQCLTCQDIKIDTITVIAGVGPSIDTVGCYSTLCASDTPLITQYSTTSTCSPLTWSIPPGSGTITAGQFTNLVTIQWNPLFTGTPTVTLTVPITCSGGCAASTTIQVPIIYPSLPIAGPDPVCVGSNNVYSVPLLPGCYYWGSFSTTGNASVNGVLPKFNSNAGSINAGSIPGTFTLTVNYYDSLKGCGGSSTKTVTVKDKFQIKGADLKVCEGSTGFYLANGNATWQVDSAGITIGTYVIPAGSTASITWLNPGIYTLIATASPSTPFCNPADQVVVNVIAKPVLTTIQPLSFNICPGDIMNIHISSTNYQFPFTWTITGGTILANDDTTVTVQWGITGGTIAVVQNNPNLFCPSNTLTFTASLYPSPSLTGPLTACEDETKTYTALPAGMPEYQWTVANGSILSQTGNTVTVLWAGSTNPHTVSVSTCTGSASLTVTVNSATPTSVILGTVNCFGASLTSSVAGAAPYAWYNNGVLQAPTTQSITATSSGYWTCIPSGCYKAGGIAVALPAPPVLNITTPVNTFCLSSTSPNIPSITFLSAITVGGPYTYQWYGPTVNNGPSVTIGSNIPTHTTSPFTYIGNYYLVVTYGGGCTVTSNVIHIDTACAPPCTLPAPPYTVTFTDNCGPGGTMNFVETFVPAVPPPGTTLLWSFGDGGSGTSVPGAGISHVYTLPGIYQVCCTTKNANFCDFVECRNITVNFVPDFSVTLNCFGAVLNNTSQVLAGTGAYTVSWNTIGGSISPAAGNTTTLTGSGTVTMTITYGTCVTSITKVITVPGTNVGIIAPSTACQFDVNAMTTSPAPSNFASFSWNFGDATTSSVAPTNHAYNSPGTYIINLSVVNFQGCVATGKDTIIINPLPASSLVTSDSFICRGSFATLTATSGMTSYTWYKDGSVIPGSGNTLVVNSFGIYTVEVTNANGCKKLSNKMPIIVLPLPKYSIDFPNGTVACVNAIVSAALPVSATLNNNYVYSWSATAPLSVTPNNATPTTIFVPAGTTSGTYALYLTVIDTTTGCSKSDTVCIVVRQAPTVSITPPGPLCEGVQTVLTPNIINTVTYNYNWSNNIAIPLDTVTLAGNYTLTITDKSSGCSASSNTVYINPQPDLRLFPLGCDTLCSNEKLYIPLPNNLSTIAPGGVYPTIQWYVDGLANVTGNYLYLNTIALGSHQVHVTVTNNFGCSNTSADYNIFVIDCDTCIVDAQFTYNLHGDTAIFHNSSSGNGSVSYIWNFGDGDTSHMQNPVHVYDSAAVYTVCVYVINHAPDGTECRDSFCICVCICHKDSTCDEFLNYLQNQTITANLVSSPTVTFTPPIIAATDIVRWDYTCDGIIDLVTTGNTPVTHNYVSNGNYVLCARIERIVNGDTCWATLTKYVEIRKQVADTCHCDNSFTGNVNSGYATSTSGNVITFVPIALTNCDTVTWNFGDGSPVVVTVGNTAVSHTYANTQMTYYVCMMVVRAGSPNCRMEFCKKVSFPTGINALAADAIKVYPNPTNDVLYIEVTKASIPSDAMLVLSEMTGRKVLENNWMNTSAKQQMNLYEVGKGVYILTIVDKEGNVLSNTRVIKY